LRLQIVKFIKKELHAAIIVIFFHHYLNFPNPTELKPYETYHDRRQRKGHQNPRASDPDCRVFQRCFCNLSADFPPAVTAGGPRPPKQPFWQPGSKLLVQRGSCTKSAGSNSRKKWAGEFLGRFSPALYFSQIARFSGLFAFSALA
jgi:hypothetical protein